MLNRLDRILLLSNYVVVGTFLFFMFVFVLLNVVTRYFFGFTLNWAEEVSRFLMIAICFLGAGIGIREGRHVAIELFTNWLPNLMLQRVFRAINGGIIILFMLALTYLGFIYAESQMSSPSAVLRWNMGYIYLVIPIGALIFIMHLVVTIKDFINVKSVEDHPDIQGGGGEPK